MSCIVLNCHVMSCHAMWPFELGVVACHVDGWVGSPGDVFSPVVSPREFGIKFWSHRGCWNSQFLRVRNTPSILTSATFSSNSYLFLLQRISALKGFAKQKSWIKLFLLKRISLCENLSRFLTPSERSLNKSAPSARACASKIFVLCV